MMNVMKRRRTRNSPLFDIVWCVLEKDAGAVTHIATHLQILSTSHVEYPFPPVGIVGAADGKNRRAFFFNHKDTPQKTLSQKLINNLYVLMPLWLSLTR